MTSKETTNKFNQKLTLVNMSIEEMKSNVNVDNTNFHDCTVANWIEKDVDFVADYKSGSGSEYMYTSEGIYRRSNHWTTKINTCVWLLNGSEEMKDTIAFCAYSDFKKYSSKRDRKNRLSNEHVTLQENIKQMLNGEMVLRHRIGTIV